MMKKKGFTLVEVVTATVILSMLAAGVYSVMVSAKYLVARSKRRLIAIEIARREIENKRQAVRYDWWDSPGNPLDPTNVWSGWQPVFDTFQWRYKVDDLSATEDLGRKIAVQVQWQEERI